MFNLFAFSALTLNPIISLVIASLFAVSMMIWIRRKIIRFDLKKIDKREYAAAEET